MRLSQIAAVATPLAAVGLFVAACTSQPASRSPLSPSGVTANVLALEGGKGSCSDGIDNDGDKLVDCADTECAEDAACKGGGTPCSPGFWKNHLSEFNAICGQVSGWTCESLMTALTCKGSDASCRRSDAAAALNAISGCTE